MVGGVRDNGECMMSEGLAESIGGIVAPVTAMIACDVVAVLQVPLDTPGGRDGRFTLKMPVSILAQPPYLLLQHLTGNTLMLRLWRHSEVAACGKTLPFVQFQRMHP